MLISTVGMAGAQVTSTAVVDTQEIFKVHPSFQEVQQELRTRQTEMKKELKELGKEEAKERQKEMQQELQKLQKELVAKAIEEVNQDIGNMASELGYEVVINKNGIISGEKELGAEDITDKVITKVKEKYDLS